MRELRGRRAWLGLYDQCIEDARGYVMADQIALSDSPAATPGGDLAAALAQVRRQAVAAIRRNAPAAAADPQRPVFHYAPPAQRMNDPNGPAWANGWHHVFYQHMVFEGSGPAIDVHWGHARSRDLVHWETLPLAMAPAYDLGELSCFSGNLAWDQHGEPVQFVTMVPYKRDTLIPINANADGSYGTVRIPPMAAWSLTNRETTRGFAEESEISRQSKRSVHARRTPRCRHNPLSI